MARELRNLGWNVEVYNSVPEEKDYEGVIYKPWWAFNPDDAIDVFIGWRQPRLFKIVQLKAKVKYLWMHDAISDAEFTPEILSKLDKVIVLSKFHRSLFPSIPEEKILYSANGLHWPDMDQRVERVPWKLINTSAPERGIKTLLELWPEIRKSYPQAELYWYYGWQTYDAAHSNNPERMAYKASIKELLKQEGVHEGGRIGHKEIAKETASSDLWVYPTEFPEISCISAMKAQALGAIPVCTTFGALDETVRNGVKLDYRDFYSNKKAQEEFISSLADARLMSRDKIREDAKVFSWENVASKWQENFNKFLN